MKQLSSVVLIILFIFSMSNDERREEKIDDCILYEKILLHWNERVASIKYEYITPKEGLDPYNPKIDSILLVNKRYANKFFIYYKKRQFSVNVLRSFIKRFNNRGGDSSTLPLLMQLKYTTADDSIINCRYNNEINYEYSDFTGLKEQWKTEIEVKGQDTIVYLPIRIMFTEVAYFENDYAVVIITYDTRPSSRLENAEYYIFKYVDNDWVLQEVGW